MTRALTIMIIDDEENDTLLFRLAVDSLGHGHTTTTFNNVQEAIQNLQDLDALHRPFPHLLLADLRMPGMDGLYLLRWLREHPRLHSVPAVVMSAAGTQRDVQEALRLGARGYLTKPSTYEDLVEMVRNLLAFSCQSDSPARPARSGQTMQPSHLNDHLNGQSPSALPVTPLPLVPPPATRASGAGLARR